MSIGEDYTNLPDAAAGRGLFSTPQVLVSASLVLLLTLIMVGAVLSYRSVLATNRVQERIEHTYQEIETLDHILLDLINAETARRGYAIAHEEGLLGPYRQGLEHLEGDLVIARQLTSHSTEQQERWTKLVPLVRQSVELLRVGVGASQSDAVSSQEITNRTSRGRELMSGIRSLVGEMQQAERKLLAEENQTQRKLSRIAARTIMLSNCLLLVLIMVLGSILIQKLTASSPNTEIRTPANVRNFVPTRGLGYAIAVFGTGVATILRGALGVMVAGLSPFITFYPAIMFSALFGGIGAGLLAIGLSSLSLTLLFLSPGTLTLDSPTEQVGFALFIGINLAVIIVSGALRTHRARTDLSEQRLLATFEQAGVGILEVSNDNDRIIAVNQRLCRILSYASGELVGKTIHDLTFPEDLEASARLNASLHTGSSKVVEHEIRYVKSDGTPVWVHVTVSAILDQRANWFRSIATVEDISQRKAAQQRLEEAKDELARTNAGLEQRIQERTARLRESVAELEGFSYSLVHDMRAPLRAMEAYAALLELEAGFRIGAEGLDHLRKIRTAAKRMDSLVTDSLNYSLLLQSELPIQPLDVGELIKGIVETYPNLQIPGAEIRVEFQSLVVLGNQAALTQVFSNLLGNAVKFVTPGVAPRVRVWAEFRPCSGAAPRAQSPEKHRCALIWVEDNGIGIPAEGQERIFRMFERLHRGEEYPGTGIGLALVKKSLERIGGRVCVDSVVGKGSRFCVELPLPFSEQLSTAK